MFKLANDILATGKLSPSPTLIMPKGLASVPEGFRYMMDGKVRLHSLEFSRDVLTDHDSHFVGERPKDHLSYCGYAEGMSSMKAVREGGANGREFTAKLSDYWRIVDFL